MLSQTAVALITSNIGKGGFCNCLDQKIDFCPKNCKTVVTRYLQQRPMSIICFFRDVALVVVVVAAVVVNNKTRFLGSSLRLNKKVLAFPTI